MRVGLCGLGTVGSSVVNLFANNAEIIAERLGRPLELTLVGARRDNPACDISAFRVTRDVMEVARDPDVDIMIELIGGVDTAFELVRTALQNGKHVVTANKALLAERGEELALVAQQNNLALRYEAAVAAGIPIIESLRNGLAANRIDQAVGIINGTCNFILSAMHQRGLSFNDALAEASEKGYAEADPTLDLEGIDAAHKLAILASLSFGTAIDFSNVYIEGIRGIDTVDVSYASRLGYRLKHLGIARRVQRGSGTCYEMRVHPTLVPQDSLVAQVEGVTNAVMLDSEPLGRSLFCGPGAGAGATASSVVADVVGIARFRDSDMQAQPVFAFQPDMRSNLALLPIDEVESANYLRLNAVDRPGVLAKVTKILADERNSIESMMQIEPDHSKATANHVPVILLIKPIAEYRIRRAISALEQLEEITGPVQRIRVDHLNVPQGTQE